MVSSYIGYVGCLLWLFDSYPVNMLVDISCTPLFLVIVLSLCQVLRCLVTGQIPCTPCYLLNILVVCWQDILVLVYYVLRSCRVVVGGVVV